jgi:hypothetical protein
LCLNLGCDYIVIQIIRIVSIPKLLEFIGTDANSCS